MSLLTHHPHPPPTGPHIGLNGGYKPCVVSLGVGAFVPYSPYAAAGNNTTVTLSQCPMLPKDILQIGSMPKLPVIIPWLYTFTNN